MNAEKALHLYYTKSRISQPELAMRLNVSQASVHNWLSGKRRIPMEHYGLIAALCGVHLSELLPDNWKILLESPLPSQKN